MHYICAWMILMFVGIGCCKNQSSISTTIGNNNGINTR